MWVKDLFFIPVFLFFFFFFVHDRLVLAIFFAGGSLLNAIFYACNKRVKDAVSAVVMWVFSMTLLWAPTVKDPGRWPYLFYFAVIVDVLSIISRVVQFFIDNQISQ